MGQVKKLWAMQDMEVMLPRSSGLQNSSNDIDTDSDNLAQYHAEFNTWLDAYEKSFGEKDTEEDMVNYWGERCPDYDRQCPICRAWKEFEQSGEIIK